MRGMIIDCLLISSLLARTLYPNFIQAHYFETAACLFLSMISVLFIIGTCLAFGEKKKSKKYLSKRSKSAEMFFWFRKMILILSLIYASHYFIGVCFFFSLALFESAREAINE